MYREDQDASLYSLHFNFNIFSKYLNKKRFGQCGKDRCRPWYSRYPGEFSYTISAEADWGKPYQNKTLTIDN